jgi:hypothetical protein
VLEGTTVNGIVEVTDPLELDTVIVPVAAVEGTTNVRLVGVAVATGAAVRPFPPPCKGTRMLAGTPRLETRVVPVIVTDVPMGPDAGAKLVIVGTGSPVPIANPFGAVASSQVELAKVRQPLAINGVSAVIEMGPAGVPGGIVKVTVKLVGLVTTGTEAVIPAMGRIVVVVGLFVASK